LSKEHKSNFEIDSDMSYALVGQCFKVTLREYGDMEKAITGKRGFG